MCVSSVYTLYINKFKVVKKTTKFHNRLTSFAIHLFLIFIDNVSLLAHEQLQVRIIKKMVHDSILGEGCCERRSDEMNEEKWDEFTDFLRY